MESNFQALNLELGRTSSVDQVSSSLRNLIWAGELAPGTKLQEVQISKAFGVSRPTIREAIRQLTTEGLIHHEMHYGATVRSLDDDDIADLYRVRRMLELEAVSREPADHDSLNRLRQAVEDMESDLDGVDEFQVVEQDCRFHAAVVGLRASPRMDRFFAQLIAELRLALGIHLVADETGVDVTDQAGSIVAESRRQAATEHRLIFERIASGLDVRESLEEHLNRGERRLRGLIATTRQ